MEEDRAASNVGPDLWSESSGPVDREANEEKAQDLSPPVKPQSEGYDKETQQDQSSKQPRRRFVGRRAAAQRSPQNPTDGQPTSLQPSKPHNPRILNQVPPEILQDLALQSAIAHLPSNYSFELPKTIHRIRSSGCTSIALQFPEGLLLFAPLISDIITNFCPGTSTLIMGDVTYGACCVDDYTARALGCDFLVHYGHSCLVPVDQTGGIKTLYVFVTIGIDADHLMRTIEANFQPGRKIALVGTIQFNATLHSIAPKLRASGYEVLLPRSAPLSAGEILGCTAPTLTAKGKTTDGKERLGTGDADMILYVGDGRFHLESILIASPELRQRTYRYDPYSRRLTHETYEHAEMHHLRRNAITTARQTMSNARTAAKAAEKEVEVLGKQDPKTWGIILGTLGRQGNPHTLDLITAHLTHLGIPYVTLLLSEVQPGKLALMSRDVGVWVQIACPRLSIDWGYAFERPLLSPYEAMVALEIRDGGEWLRDGSSDFSGTHQNHHDGEMTVAQAVGERDMAVYPMDFYGKEGLGRTKAEDVPTFHLEIEVR